MLHFIVESVSSGLKKMVLVMVMHTLVEVTATVPMAMILLKDFMIKKQIPNGFKLRMVSLASPLLEE